MRVCALLLVVGGVSATRTTTLTLPTGTATTTLPSGTASFTLPSGSTTSTVTLPSGTTSFTLPSGTTTSTVTLPSGTTTSTATLPSGSGSATRTLTKSRTLATSAPTSVTSAPSTASPATTSAPSTTAPSTQSPIKPIAITLSSAEVATLVASIIGNDPVASALNNNPKKTIITTAEILAVFTIGRVISSPVINGVISIAFTITATPTVTYVGGSTLPQVAFKVTTDTAAIASNPNSWKLAWAFTMAQQMGISSAQIDFINILIYLVSTGALIAERDISVLADQAVNVVTPFTSGTSTTSLSLPNRGFPAWALALSILLPIGILVIVLPLVFNQDAAPNAPFGNEGGEVMEGRSAPPVGTDGTDVV